MGEEGEILGQMEGERKKRDQGWNGLSTMAYVIGWYSLPLGLYHIISLGILFGLKVPPHKYRGSYGKHMHSGDG